jgi:poly(A) polymerase
MLRLAAIVPPDRERLAALAARLRLSKAEAAYLAHWASAPVIEPEMKETALDRLLYRQGVDGVKTRLKLALASARADLSGGEAAMQKVARLSTLLTRANKFHKPGFPLSGADVMAAGVESGPKVGEVLKSLEEKWIDVNFSLDRAALTARLKDMLEN